MYIWCWQIQLGYKLETMFGTIPRITVSILTHMFWWILLLLFGHQVMFDSLQPHNLQHTRLPCLSLSYGVCSNSSPLSQWCHPTISSSVASFSSCPQSFPASKSFPMSWPSTLGDQSIGALVSASVLPKNIQGWFPLGFTGFISL